MISAKIDLICSHSRSLSCSFQSAAPKQTSFQLGLLFCETQTPSVSPASSRILFGQPEKSCKESNCFSGSSWQSSQKMQAQLFATTSARFAAANRLLRAMHLKKNSQFKPAFSSNARQTWQSIGHRLSWLP